MKPKVTTDYKTGQATIFKNSFLEKLTKTNPIQNIIFYSTTIILLIYFAYVKIGLSALQISLLFVFGIAFWTLAEYILHRYVFHWVNESKWSQRFHFIMHGSHHEFPLDEERLLMPPVPGFILASILFVGFFIIFWILGISDLTYGFFPGFFCGYLMYSFVHRTTHVIKRPPKRLKNLWHHHSLHHYKYPNKAFGVSNTFWDKVFGTMPPKKIKH